jgi:hypothetical protein
MNKSNIVDKILLIDEILHYRLLEDNYDGEGATAPNFNSVSLALDFVNLFTDDIIIPEAMINPNGNIGLFWEVDNLYADLEFYEDDKISYYIKINKDSHRGSLLFERPNFPEIFYLLLSKKK